MHKGRKLGRAVFTKAAQTGKHLPAQLFLMQANICAEYHKKLMQTLLPHSFRCIGRQDSAVLYKV